MSILLLGDSLKVDIFLDETDAGFEDNICIRLVEDCPAEEMLLKADETNIYVTADEVSTLILHLQRVLQSYRRSLEENS
jgi:hypothetical protein